MRNRVIAVAGLVLLAGALLMIRPGARPQVPAAGPRPDEAPVTLAGEPEIATRLSLVQNYAASIDLLNVRPSDRRAYLADLNGDGALDMLDLLAFQRWLDAGDMRADFSGDGALDHMDSLAFQSEMVARTREPEVERHIMTEVVALRAASVQLRLQYVTESGAALIELVPPLEPAVESAQ